MDTTQETISRIKFIGRLNKGDKINTRHMYVQPYGVITAISRMFLYQDNRGNTLNFCHNTITRSFDLLTFFAVSNKNSDKVLYMNLLKDLHQAKIGLVNLKFTYVTDTKMCCDLDTLMDCITSNKHVITHSSLLEHDIVNSSLLEHDIVNSSCDEEEKEKEKEYIIESV